MTGLGSSTISRSRPVIEGPALLSEPVPAAARSAPEQNTRPVWVSTTTRTDGSSPAALSRADSSSMS
jgi:hypothetical protein